MKRILFAILAFIVLLSAGCQPSAPGDQGPVEVLPEATPVPTPLALEPAEETAMLAAGKWHIALLRDNGSVLAAGDNRFGQCDVSEWQDVAFIAAGADTTAGLTKDGKLLIAGARTTDFEAALSWENIVKIAVGNAHIVGLKSDGTVVAAGDNSLGQCDVSLWKDVVDIKAAADYSLAKGSGESVFSAGAEPAEWDLEAEIPEITDGTWTGVQYAVQNEIFRAAILEDGSIACAGDYADLSNLTANWNVNGDSAPEANDPNAEKMNAAIQKNDDIIGYISVPGVDIDRPIFYAEKWYYNDHDINKEKSEAGEVYSYKSEKQQINAITAHNMRVSGTMFHELHHIQAFNNGIAECEYEKCSAKLTNSLPDLTKYPDRVWNISLFGFTRWEVFAYYEVKANEPETTLYYNTNFAKDPSKMNIEEWIKIQTTRSELKLDVAVTPEDTFLTVLTCGDEHDSSDAQSRLYFFLKAIG